MREVIAEIVEVLNRHGMDVDLDSAQIEWNGEQKQTLEEWIKEKGL